MLRSLGRRLTVEGEKVGITVPKANYAALGAGLCSRHLTNILSLRTCLASSRDNGSTLFQSSHLVDRLQVGSNVRSTAYLGPWYFAIELFQFFPGELAWRVARVGLVRLLVQGNVVLTVLAGEVGLVEGLALSPVDASVVVVARWYSYEVSVVVEEGSQQVKKVVLLEAEAVVPAAPAVEPCQAKAVTLLAEDPGGCT